jgi:hypothetical protein
MPGVSLTACLQIAWLATYAGKIYWSLTAITQQVFMD